MKSIAWILLIGMTSSSVLCAEINEGNNRAVERLCEFFEIPATASASARQTNIQERHPVGESLLSTMRKLLDRADELNWELNIFYLPAEIHVKWDTIQEWDRYEAQVSFFFDEERELTRVNVSTSVVQGAPIKERIDFELPPPLGDDVGSDEANE